jgi:hypothetical protein
LLGRHEESDAMPVFTQEAELGCIEWEAWALTTQPRYPVPGASFSNLSTARKMKDICKGIILEILFCIVAGNGCTVSEQRRARMFENEVDKISQVICFCCDYSSAKFSQIPSVPQNGEKECAAWNTCFLLSYFLFPLLSFGFFYVQLRTYCWNFGFCS